jgi:hypothetical protein
MPEDLVRVLRAARDRQLDGYVLMSRTGLDRDKLTSALEQLASRGLVSVKGDIHASSIGDALVAVPPDAIGDVDSILMPYKGRSARMRSGW